MSKMITIFLTKVFAEMVHMNYHTSLKVQKI